MNLRGADLRFVVPHVVATASVLGSADDLRLRAVADGLRTAGVRLVEDTPDVPVDLLVAAHRADLAGWPARAALLTGPERGGARSGGLPLLVRPGPGDPQTVLPLDDGRPLRHHLTALAAPSGRSETLRNRLLATMAAGPLPPRTFVPAASVVRLVVDGTDDRPALLRAAAGFGVPTAAPWVLALGRGDDLQRAVFHVVGDGQEGWVVKFSRVRGHTGPFERDEVGLRLVAAAGTEAARHAPVLLARFELDGHPASVETLAPGRPLLRLLPGRPWPLLDRVVGWTTTLALRTRSPDDALAPELHRLRGLVSPEAPTGVASDLVDRLPPLPGVLQHNDLGSWNIHSDGRGFVVLDWESARQPGLPLWDLLYFAADVLARVDGPADPATLVRRTLDVAAGRSVHSPVLFGWLLGAARTLGVPRTALGPLAALCWLHHGRSAERRAADLQGAAPAPLGHLAQLGAPWLSDPALGADWPALPG